MSHDTVALSCNLTAVFWNIKEGWNNFLLSFQGISLRKVLLQNYLFPNKKNNPKNDLAELGAAGTLLHTLPTSLCCCLAQRNLRQHVK